MSEGGATEASFDFGGTVPESRHRERAVDPSDGQQLE